MFIGRDRVLHTAAVDVPRIEWVDLDGDGIRETPGLLIESSRVNSCLRSEEFDNATWGKLGTPTVVANAVVAPDALVSMDRIVPAALSQNPAMTQAITITADEFCAPSVFVKPSGYGAVVVRFGNGGSTQGFQASFDASTGLFGSIGAGFGGGTLTGKRAVGPFADGSYRVELCGKIAGAITAGQIFIYVYPDIATANAQNAFTGDGVQGVYLWGAQLERLGTVGGAGPTSYMRTLGAPSSARGADVVLLSLGFPPTDITVLSRVARPFHADVTGTFDHYCGIVAIGNQTEIGGASLRILMNRDARIIEHCVVTPGSDMFPSLSIPAGAEISPCAQFRAFTTGAFTKLDVGSGFGAEAGAVSAVTSWDAPVLQVGRFSAGTEFDGVITGLLVARGLFTRPEMLAY